MNAILIWIFFPMGIAGLLFLFQSQRRLITLIGFGVALLLAGLAWVFPVGRVTRLFSWVFEITGQFSVYGRQIILTPADSPVITLLYLIVAFWFLGSLATEVPAHFVPLGLASVGIIITGISIEPFFYAAILFEFVALIFVLLLSIPGHPPSEGVLRFLIFQTLGMLFILFAGWSLSRIDINAPDAALLARSLVIMGLGFSFLLGIFPFLTWFPMLAHRNNIYLTAFMFNIFLNGVILFGLDFLNQYAWVSTYFDLREVLQVVGVFMIGTGGLMAVFQNNLGRTLGYAMIAEVGRSLLSISLGADGLAIYFALLIFQVWALGLWSLSLDTLSARTQNLDFRAVTGLARELPFPIAGILLVHFSLAGLPLLGAFPLYWYLGNQLVEQASLGPAVWLLLGGIGLAIEGTRTLHAFIIPSEEAAELATLKNFSIILLILGGSALILFGLFPQYLIQIGNKMALAF